jgi:predicted nucleic acid-binding protein
VSQGRSRSITSLVPVLFVEIVVDRPVILAMRAVDRMQVPELPDQVIAATAVRLGVPLISRDRKIQDPGSKHRE